MWEQHSAFWKKYEQGTHTYAPLVLVTGKCMRSAPAFCVLGYVFPLMPSN